MAIKYIVEIRNTRDLLEALRIMSFQVAQNLDDESELIRYVEECIGKVQEYLES
jgi:hypothetical protein